MGTNRHQQAKATFLQISGLRTEVERQTALARLRALDAELFREVQALLAAERQVPDWWPR